MDSAVLEQFRAQLLAMRQALLDTQDAAGEAAQPVQLDQASVGRLSRMDALQGQAMALENQRRRAIALRRLDIALARIDSGDYGYCSDCDSAINVKRLAVDPGTPLCIQCAQRQEKSGR